MAPLIKIEDTAGLFPIRPGNTTQDSKLTMLINTASVLIEQAISRELEKQSRIEFFDAPNTFTQYYDFNNPEDQFGVFTDPRPVRFMLAAFNIDTAQLFEVRYDINRAFDDTTIVDPKFYFLDADKGILRIKFPMFESLQTIKITYTGGYAANTEGNLSDTIPTEIKMACIAQVMHMFGKLTLDNIGKTMDTTEGKTAGGGAYATKAGLVPEALSLIAKYKRVGMSNN